MSFVNEKARQGTLLAHTEGGVANLILEANGITAEDIGYMIYFFEKVCAVSGLYPLVLIRSISRVLKATKKNMFALLGKPGYENEKEKLEKELGI